MNWMSLEVNRTWEEANSSDCLLTFLCWVIHERANANGITIDAN